MNVLLEFSVKEVSGQGNRYGYDIEAFLAPEAEHGLHCPELGRELIRQGVMEGEVGCQYFVSGDGLCMVQFQVSAIEQKDIVEKIAYHQAKLRSALTEAVRIRTMMKAIDAAAK